MSKIVIFNEEARKKLKAGVDVIYNAVKVTLGPKGRNIVLDRGILPPVVTNDGVSIAKDIVLKDKVENLGAEIVKDVANKTNDNVGDGTTSSIVLTRAILDEGLRHLDSGTNAITLKNGIKKAAAEVVEKLKEMAIPVKNSDDILKVATISSESPEIGKIIAGTVEKVGKEGTVTVEESRSMGVTSEVVNGMKIEKGYISPYMVTDNDKMTAEYSNVPVLITDKKIISAREIVPLLEKIVNSGKNELFIVADGVEGDALSTFIINKLKGVFKMVAIQAPGFGNDKKERLQDIAVLTGGTVLAEEMGLKFDNVEYDILGIADKVIVGKDSTIIVSGSDRKELIQNRINAIKEQKKSAESKHDISKYEDRISKLSGGVAVIKVGAATESEMKYLKLKIEDAVNATKAAIEEGIVAGGGSALARIANNMDSSGLKKEMATGYEIVKKAITMPIKQIILNTGIEDGAFIVKKIQDSKNTYCGYDALQEKLVENMIEEGIIDPVKVVKTAVENASSAASTLLTTEGCVVEEPKKEDKTN